MKAMIQQLGEDGKDGTVVVFKFEAEEADRLARSFGTVDNVIHAGSLVGQAEVIGAMYGEEPLSNEERSKTRGLLSDLFGVLYDAGEGEAYDNITQPQD